MTRPYEFKNRRGRSIVSKFLVSPHRMQFPIFSLDKVPSYHLRGRTYQAARRVWKLTLSCNLQGPYHAIFTFKINDSKVQIFPSVCSLL
jgi:hypothetical protein